YVRFLCRCFENSVGFRLGGGSRRGHRCASWILEIAFPAAPRLGRCSDVILLNSSTQGSRFSPERLCNGFDKKSALVWRPAGAPPEAKVSNCGTRSRFTSWENSGRPTISRLGFVNLDGDRQIFFVLPEAFKNELCKGFDSASVARAFKDGGALITTGTKFQK